MRTDHAVVGLVIPESICQHNKPYFIIFVCQKFEFIVPFSISYETKSRWATDIHINLIFTYCDPLWIHVPNDERDIYSVL